MTIASRPVIRPVAPTDFDAWHALWRGYQAFYKVDIPMETSRETWRRLLDPAEKMHGALAFAGEGAPCGMVNYVFHRSTWATGDYCYLGDLYVAETQRGGGIGRALIEHVYEAARQAGSPRVYWMTHETNATAMRLYDQVAERSGFVQYRKTIVPA